MANLQESLMGILGELENGEAIIERLNKEVFPNHFVPKPQYNKVAGEKEAMKSQLSEIASKKQASDGEDWETKYSDLARENEELRNASTTAEERAQKKAAREAKRIADELEEDRKNLIAERESLFRERSVVRVSDILAKSGFMPEEDDDTLIADLICSTPDESTAKATRYVERMKTAQQIAAKTREKELYANPAQMRGIPATNDGIDPALAAFNSGFDQ